MGIVLGKLPAIFIIFTLSISVTFITAGFIGYIIDWLRHKSNNKFKSSKNWSGFIKMGFVGLAVIVLIYFITSVIASTVGFQPEVIHDTF